MFRYTLTALLFSAISVVPAFAQTKAEVAAQNIQLAITLCVQNSHDGAALRAAFASTGHSYTAEDFGGGEVRHHYGTPDATVATAVSLRGPTPHCSISTDQYGVSQMIPFARAVLDQLYEGPIWDGSPEAVNVTLNSPDAASKSCSGFHILPGRTVIWFQFGTQGQDPVCVENGTAQIMISL
ncbi:MAG: hypothetical protein AAF943_02050 [Pseudomonadota bacterium]